MPVFSFACPWVSWRATLEIDTIHDGLMLWKPLREVLPLMSQYDLVVIDELSQLSDAHFDFIAQMWQAAGAFRAFCSRVTSISCRPSGPTGASPSGTANSGPVASNTRSSSTTPRTSGSHARARRLAATSSSVDAVRTALPSHRQRSQGVVRRLPVGV